MMRACRWPGCARWPSSLPSSARCCCSPPGRACGSGCGRSAAGYARCRMAATTVPQLAEQQRRAYPDIVPAVLAAGPEVAFARALDAARAMGWEIVDAQPKEGRIEATATTFWFGFKDDVVVRITPLSAGSRIDVRSKSRVGRGDTGTNAQRVRAYLKRLN